MDKILVFISLFIYLACHNSAQDHIDVFLHYTALKHRDLTNLPPITTFFPPFAYYSSAKSFIKMINHLRLYVFMNQGLLSVLKLWSLVLQMNSLKTNLDIYHYVIFCTSYCIYKFIYQGLSILLMAYLFHFLLVFISFY